MHRRPPVYSSSKNRELREKLYFVVIRLWDPAKQPEFFVLTHNELKEAWQKMPLTKPNGKPYKRTGHLAWQYLESYLERWGTLPTSESNEAAITA